MSHIAETKIAGLNENVNESILNEAISMMVGQGVLNISHTDTIKDFYGNESDVEGIGVRVGKDEYGIDVLIKDDEIQLRSEDMNGINERRFKEELIKAYTTVALAKCLSTENMVPNANIELNSDRRGKYAIRARTR